MEKHFNIFQDLLRNKAELQARLNLIPYEGTIEIKEIDSKFHIKLDKTAFFPGGGGQFCDLGTIDVHNVIDVYEEKEDIYPHLEHIIMPQDTILLKASHGMGFADLVSWFEKTYS